MTERNITASTPLLVAIDISKGRHEVLIEVPDKKRRRRVNVLNTLDEFERLITLLRSFQRPVRVAFEATGNYHRALAFQPPPGLDPEVQFKLPVDAVNAFMVPAVSLHIAHIQETETETPGLFHPHKPK